MDNSKTCDVTDINDRWSIYRELVLPDDINRIIRTPGALNRWIEDKKTRKPTTPGFLSERSIAFFEAVLVVASHKIQIGDFGRDRVIHATNDQLAQIAADRWPKVQGWAGRQIEREKRKFISRPGDGKPAIWFELLREVEKGHHNQGRNWPGTPSVYEITGLWDLLPASLSTR